DADLTRLCECLECLHGRGQFHAVVGGVLLETRRGLAVGAVLEEVGPTAPARGGVAGAVGEHRDALERHAPPAGTWSSTASRTATAAPWRVVWVNERWTRSPLDRIVAATSGLRRYTGRLPSFTTHTSVQPRPPVQTLANASLAANLTARPGTMSARPRSSSISAGWKQRSRNFLGRRRSTRLMRSTSTKSIPIATIIVVPPP